MLRKTLSRVYSTNKHTSEISGVETPLLPIITYYYRIVFKL